MTVSEANAKLLAALPKTSFSIDFELWNHYLYDSRRDLETCWKVYNTDTRTHYEGKTLEEAVLKTIAAIKAQSLKDAETSLADVLCKS